jgi:hypothetical protein
VTAQEKLVDYFNKTDSTRDTISVRTDKVSEDDLIVLLAGPSNALMQGSCRPAGPLSSNDSPVPRPVKSIMLKSDKRKFLLKWKEEFPQLQFENDMAKCSVHPQFNTLCDSSHVVAGFTQPCRHDTFNFKSISGQYIRCMDTLNANEHSENTALASA